MTISRKISLSFLVSAVVLTAACAGIVYHFDKDRIEKNLLSHLSTAAQSRAHSIEIYLNEHVNLAELNAANTSIRELLLACKGGLAGGHAGRDVHLERALEETDRSIETEMGKDPHVNSLSIINHQGIVVASSSDWMVGTSLAEDDCFKFVAKETHITDVHWCAAGDQAALCICVPVRDKERPLGVISLELSVDEMYEILLDETGLGETGEAYLVNSGGYMISPSRFVQDTVLKQKVESRNLARCWVHKNGPHLPLCTDKIVYTDYRGAQVIGTHYYIPSMGWALLAEIDAKEALSPLQRLKLMAAGFLVAVPLLALLIGTYVSRSIAGPIDKLREGVKIIGGGNFAHRVDATSKDEIGDLGRAFDEMAGGLGKATTTIDRLNAEIEERQRAQKALVRLERLKALEEMAGGVSHNLNNILVGVLGHAQLLENAAESPKVLDQARAIVKSARRAESLVHRLSVAVRGEDAELGPVDVVELTKEVVSGMLLRLRSEAPENGRGISILFESGYAPLACATRSGVIQILNNLIQNSVEAMPDGGEIRISLAEVDDSVSVSVSDTGQGMDGDIQSRVVEPFFTTKAEVGKGLGLSTVYGMATRWEGRLDIDSEPGHGTTVTVTLPVWHKSAAGKSDGLLMPDEGRNGSRDGRVLIVDDEEIITRTLGVALEGLGTIRIAGNGQEALEILKTTGFDVAIVDLGLPGMPADMLAGRLKEKDPGLVTVLMTGWNMGEDDPMMEDFDYWIRKPFKDLRHVRDIVARALDLHEKRAADLVVASNPPDWA